MAGLTEVGVGVVFLGFLYNYTSSFPFGDDLPAIYQYWADFSEEDSVSGKLRKIFTNSYVEHRLLFLSLLVWLNQVLFGTISLPFLCVCAGLTWTGVVCIYREWLYQARLSVWWGVVLTLLLLSGATYQAAHWAMAALQHFSVVFLCFLTVFLLSRQLTVSYLAGALITAFACTFSSGNGMLIWVSGLIVLLANRDRKWLPCWLAGMVLAVCLYLSGMGFGHTPSGRSLSSVFDGFCVKLMNWVAGPAGALRVEGRVLDFTDSEPVFSMTSPMIYAGILMLVLLLRVVFLAFRRKDFVMSALAGISVFLLLTYALITFGRSLGESTFIVFKSRYYTYSLVAICNAVFALAWMTRTAGWHAWFRRGALVLSWLFWLAWQFSSYVILLNQQNILETGYVNAVNRGKWVIYQATSFYENYYNSFFRKPSHGKLLALSPPLLQAYRTRQFTSAGFSACHDFRVVPLGNGDFYQVTLENEAAPPIQTAGEGYLLAMASERDTFLLPGLLRRNAVRAFLKSGRPTRSGYTINLVLRKKDFPPAGYRLHQFYFRKNKGVFSRDTVGIIPWEERGEAGR